MPMPTTTRYDDLLSVVPNPTPHAQNPHAPTNSETNSSQTPTNPEPTPTNIPTLHYTPLPNNPSVSQPLHYNNSVTSLLNGNYALAEESLLRITPPLPPPTLPPSLTPNYPPQTLDCISNLGVLYRLTSNLALSQRYADTALDGRRRIYGDRGGWTVKSMNNLANVQEDRGRREAAYKIYNHAISLLPPEDLNTDIGLTVLGNYASLSCKLYDSPSSLAFLESVVERKSKHLGRKSRSTLVSLDNLGCAYMSSSDDPGSDSYRKAEVAFGRVEEGMVEVMGKGHPEVLDSYDNISIMHAKAGRYGEAVRYKDMAIEGWRELEMEDTEKVRTMKVWRERWKHRKEGLEVDMGAAEETVLQGINEKRKLCVITWCMIGIFTYLVYYYFVIYAASKEDLPLEDLSPWNSTERVGHNANETGVGGG